MSDPTQDSREFDIGYLAGLVDAEGYIVTAYKKQMDRTYPGLRIYSTSKTIIDGACRILSVNPHPRRDGGNLVGWTASVQGKKAIDCLSQIYPHLTDASKRSRTLTILLNFEGSVSIKGKHLSSRFFSKCPPPVRSRVHRHTGISIPEPFAARGSDDPVQVPVLMEQRPSQVIKRQISNGLSIADKGWLCGMVDGEGYVHIRYRSDRDSVYPRLRIFVKSRPMIEKAARLMGVNPYGRRKLGKIDGWYASVSHRKALRILRLLYPGLLDPSKKCRTQTILETFGEVGTIHSRIMSIDFFRGCPPPSKPRKSGRIINASRRASNSEVGKPGHPGGLIDFG